MSLDPTYNEISMSDLVVHSHDKNSYRLNFEFSDGCDNPLPLIDAKPRILFVLDNDIMQLYQLKIDSERLGEASFTFVEPLLHYEGIASAYVYVDYDNKKHDVGGFKLRFKKSAIDGEMPEIEGYIEDIDKALKKVDELEGKSKEATDKLDGDIKDISKQIKDNDIVKKKDVSSITRENMIKDSLNDFVIKKRETGQPSDGFNYQRFNYEINGMFDYTFSSKIEVTDGSIDVVTIRFTSPIADYDVPIIDGKITATHKADGETRNSVFVYAGKQGQTHGKGMIIKKAKLEKNDQSTDYKPHISEMATKKDTKDLQSQIDKLEKAITVLGGTL